MCLLRRILALDESSVMAETVIEPGAVILNSAPGTQAWSIEIVAQAAAAFIGWHHRERGWRSGRLIKVARWEMLSGSLPLGEPLKVYSKLDTWSETGVFRFEGKLESPTGARLAGGQLTILAS